MVLGTVGWKRKGGPLAKSLSLGLSWTFLTCVGLDFRISK
jgi:hypothetical protein